MRITIETDIFTPNLINRLNEGMEIYGNYSTARQNDMILNSLFEYHNHIRRQVRVLVEFYGSVEELLKNVNGAG